MQLYVGGICIYIHCGSNNWCKEKNEEKRNARRAGGGRDICGPSKPFFSAKLAKRFPSQPNLYAIAIISIALSWPLSLSLIILIPL